MRICNWLRGRRAAKSASAIHRAAVAAAAEVLESRRLLTVSYAGGVLTISGTSSAETVTVYITGTTLNVTGAGTFGGGDATILTEINASLGDGSDWIEIDETIPDTVDIELSGDGGGDTLFSASGPATMYGGTGSDLLSGSDFADELYAGDDGDIIFAGDGNDTLVGGAGNDSLAGEEGNDTLVAAR